MGENVRTARLELRLTWGQKKAWELKANQAGVTLAEWVRRVLDGEAGYVAPVPSQGSEVPRPEPALDQPVRPFPPLALKLCLKCTRAKRVGQSVPEKCSDCGRG